MTEFNLNGFIKFPTKSQKKFKSIKWKVKGEEYVSEGGGPNIPDNIDCLCFTSTGESTIALTNRGNNAPVLYYSKDKKKWNTWDYATITLADGESVYFCGENPDGFSKHSTEYSSFIMTGSIAASGNIQTLLSPAGDRMDVTSGCYSSMFNDCTSLTTAPSLPATTLAPNCYAGMFNGCTSLTTAPVLPATTLVMGCYIYIFQDCTNLQSVTTYVTNWNTSRASNWLYNAGTNATNPTVYCPADSTIPSDSTSGIPTGWTRADLPTS